VTYRGQTSGLSAVSKSLKWEEVTDPHCLFGRLYENTEKSEMGKGTALGVLLIYYLTLESHDC